MAENPNVNKVVYNGQVLLDLTGDTATAADVATGKTFHLASGAAAVGTGGGEVAAEDVSYDNTTSGLTADNVQDAIDELSGSVNDLKPILCNSDPTAETVGKLGQHCINTTKGTEWTCVGINGDVYTWTQGGGIMPHLTITAPTGSTVTVTNGATTLTPTEYNGVWDQDVPHFGTWRITLEKSGETTVTHDVYVSALTQYAVALSFFSATLNVTAVPGATVTATSGGNSYQATAGSNGVATLSIGASGTYSVVGAYQDAASNTQSVAVTQDGGTYSTTVNFITLALTAPNGSSVTLTNGTKTFTGTGTGSAVTYYLPATGTWTATATKDGKTATNSVNVTTYAAYSLAVAFTAIYGVQWDGAGTAWTRTDDAAGFTDPVPYVAGATSYGSPFDDLAPWKDMTRVTDSEAGEMVKLTKFWYKLTQVGDGMQIQIADGPVDGFSTCPACMDRGDGAGERDYVLVGRYHCASDYKSKTGVKPVANITRPAARSSISNLGSKVWMADWAVRFTLFLLYIVEFADWNTQAKIGKGCGDNSATGNMGYTDSMPYHTGTTQSSRDTFGLGTQYRNIEGLWDNVRDWIDGCYNSGSGLMIILNPANSSDSAGGTSVGTPSNGYPSKFAVKDVSGTFPLFIPTEASGSDSTSSCDGWFFDASSPCVFVGGNYSQSTYYGLFYFDYNSTTAKGAYLGSRSMKLP